ncbi:response regulator [bacterium]|nr:response regulator [bacterium]
MTLGSVSPVPAPSASLRLLVVDDEPMLRSVIQEFLTILGFTEHHIAGDGQQALEILRNHPIDCVLSDIRMPEMELEELLGIVRKKWPDIVVIATSGYSDMESAANIIGKGAADFLGKPLNLDSLEAALRWVAWRRGMLGLAKGADSDTAAVAAALESAPVFIDKMRHARRVGMLLEKLDTGLGDSRRDLVMAGLLHEMGMCQQVHFLCEQPRSLNDHEQTLVRIASVIGGALVGQALGRRELDAIIGSHANWQAISDARIRQEPLMEAALWLGLANTIVGCTTERPDRPAIKIQRVRESLDRRAHQTPTEPLRRLLDQWPAVEGALAAKD